MGWIRGWSGPFTLVEGAGGWLVPFSETSLFRDLAVDLKPDGVLLVANARLGTINHTLLSAESIRAAGCRLVGVAVSVKPEIWSWRNRTWLRSATGSRNRSGPYRRRSIP